MDPRSGHKRLSRWWTDKVRCPECGKKVAARRQEGDNYYTRAHRDSAKQPCFGSNKVILVNQLSFHF